MKIYFYFFLLLFNVACMSNKKREIKESEAQNINSIKVTYLCGLVDTNAAINCLRISQMQDKHAKNNYSYPFIEAIDTFIVDPSIVKRIEEKLKLVIPVDSFNEDARLFATLKDENGIKKEICISNNNHPRIKINGVSYSTNNELVYLLKNYSGYYYWGIAKDEVKYLDELNDTTFVKEDFRTMEDNPYYKEK